MVNRATTERSLTWIVDLIVLALAGCGIAV